MTPPPGAQERAAAISEIHSHIIGGGGRSTGEILDAYVAQAVQAADERARDIILAHGEGCTSIDPLCLRVIVDQIMYPAVGERPYAALRARPAEPTWKALPPPHGDTW
jgi:hypothetical protein